MTNQYLVNTTGNYDYIDDPTSLANQKRSYEKTLVALGGQWGGVHDFVKTVNSGQSVHVDDFYWVTVGSLGIEKKEIFELMEKPNPHNKNVYELYGPYGEIDSRGAVRTYSFDASRMRSLKFGF